MKYGGKTKEVLVMKTKKVRDKVSKQLKGKDPKTIAWWFFDRSLVLLKEANVPKENIVERLNRDYK